MSLLRIYNTPFSLLILSTAFDSGFSDILNCFGIFGFVYGIDYTNIPSPNAIHAPRTATLFALQHPSRELMQPVERNYFFFSATSTKTCPRGPASELHPPCSMVYLSLLSNTSTKLACSPPRFSQWSSQILSLS